MSPSDSTDRTLAGRRRVDWKSWIVLGWVAWFGFLYGKMVFEERGTKIQAVLSGPKS